MTTLPAVVQAPELPAAQIPLADLLLCVNCDTGYSCREARVCPSCGSYHALALARVIRPLGEARGD